MNEFTKEELTEIHKCISWFDDMRVIGFHTLLLDKIQSMVDNYCAHKQQSIVGGVFYTCRDCGKTLWIVA